MHTVDCNLYAHSCKVVHAAFPRLFPPSIVASAGHVDTMSAVHLAARVEAIPYGDTPETSTGLNSRLSTLYFYVGIDCSTARPGDDTRCSRNVDGNFGVTVSDSATQNARSLLVTGASKQLGDFEWEATASSALVGLTELENEDTVTMAFVGKANIAIVDVKKELERMHSAHRASGRKGQAGPTSRRPFVLPSTVEDGSNVVLVQVCSAGLPLYDAVLFFCRGVEVSRFAAPFPSAFPVVDV